MTAFASPAAGGASWIDRLRPERADLIDGGFTVVLGALGIIGFRTVFAGGQELTVGLPAILAGTLVGYVTIKARIPMLAGLAVTLVSLLVLGGPLALRHRALGGVLPSLDAMSALADAAVTSWVDLLTTLPPAGRAGDHVAIPYLCGFLGAVSTVALARHFRNRSYCVLPPAVVLAVSVLMGTKRPASLVLQGVVFAAVTFAWISVRYQRDRHVNAVRSPSRFAVGAGLLAISAVGGMTVGPMLPGGGSFDRYVLRQDVEPPFDPLTEPSPLAGFRNYSDQEFRDDDILQVRGLPAGGRIHIGVMDSYSGTEWRATGSDSVLAGEYLRVGAEIPAEGYGAEADVSVDVLRPHGVWVPLGGDVTSIEFRGDRAEQLDNAVRVSIETDAAAVPSGLRAGDRYRFRAEFPTLPSTDALVETGLDGRYESYVYDGGLEIPAEFISRGAEWAGDQPTRFGEVLAMAEALIDEGAYSDGGPDANPPSPPGHSLRRLIDFIDTEQPVGNGEQYAAALGVLAQARDIPIRVVMGFVNETGADDVTFRGEDIRAWVEVPVEGLGWVAVDTTPDEDDEPDPIRQPRRKTENPEPQPPPPTTVPPATSIPNDLEPEDSNPDEEDEEDSGGIAGWVKIVAAVVTIPLLVFAVPALFILWLKHRRRRRRQRKGTPSERVSGSFGELIDRTIDAGRRVPRRATRGELAVAVDVAGADTLAFAADAATFGPAEPTDADIDGAWGHLDVCLARLREGLGRRQRIWAAVRPTSLRSRR